MTESTQTCPKCMKRLNESGGCTPLSSPDCWTVTHRYVKGKGWEPVLRVVDADRTDAEENQ